MTSQHVEEDDDDVVVVVFPVVQGGVELRGDARVPLAPAPGSPHLLLLPGSDQVADTSGDPAGHLDHPVLLGV